MPLQFGVDIILKNEPNWKQNRIAILTNDAAKTNTGIISRLALKNAGFNLIKIFSPEHGIKTIGEDGAKMHDGLDEITGLSVISLYGDKYMPTKTPKPLHLGILSCANIAKQFVRDVIKNHLHSERFGQNRNLAADVAIADDAQCFSSNLVAIGALFQPLSTVRPFAFFENASHQHNAQSNDQFGH